MKSSAPRAWPTHASLLVVQLAFAAQSVEAKIAMGPRAEGGEGISPWALAMTRMLGAALFFQAFTRATGLLRATSARDRAALAGLSVLGIVLNQTLFLLGLRFTQPTTASLLGVTIPVISAALAVGIGQERMSARLGAGLALAVGGVLALTGVHSVDVGALLVLGNSVSYAAYIVFSRGIIQRLGALTVITWLFTWGAILFAAFGAADVARGAPSWTARGWGFVAFIVVVPTIVAYLCNAWALGRSTATLVTVYIYLQPVLTAVLAWVQRGDPVTARHALAAGLIVLGVTIVATRRDAQPAPVEE